MKEFFLDHGEAIIGITLGVLVSGLIALCVYAFEVDAQQWEHFRQTHDCKVTGRMSGDLITGFTSNGSVTTAATPDKTAWTCSDGVTYWR